MTVNTTPYVIQALSHPADNFRRALAFAAHGQQGVRDSVSGDLSVSQNGTPNMSVNVAAGQALINGTQNTTSQGAYEMLNDATVNLAIAASDPTNPRIDIVCASVQDAAYSGASNQALLQVVTGTPAASPSPPATPANSIVLAQVAVAANATSITNGNITDKRPVFGSLFHAEAYLSANQSIPNNTVTVVAFDTVLADPNGNFTTGSSAHYTCPVPGRYLVLAGLNWASAAANAIGLAFKNGAEVQRTAQASGATMLVSPYSGIIRANASDTLDIRAFQASGGAVNVGAGSSLAHVEISYLGPL